jgi:hypothetical protein
MWPVLVTVHGGEVGGCWQAMTLHTALPIITLRREATTEELYVVFTENTELS